MTNAVMVRCIVCGVEKHAHQMTQIHSKEAAAANGGHWYKDVCRDCARPTCQQRFGNQNWRGKHRAPAPESQGSRGKHTVSQVRDFLYTLVYDPHGTLRPGIKLHGTEVNYGLGSAWYEGTIFALNGRKYVVADNKLEAVK